MTLDLELKAKIQRNSDLLYAVKFSIRGEIQEIIATMARSIMRNTRNAVWRDEPVLKGVTVHDAAGISPNELYSLAKLMEASQDSEANGFDLLAIAIRNELSMLEPRLMQDRQITLQRIGGRYKLVIR